MRKHCMFCGIEPSQLLEQLWNPRIAVRILLQFETYQQQPRLHSVPQVAVGGREGNKNPVKLLRQNENKRNSLNS